MLAYHRRVGSLDGVRVLIVDDVPENVASLAAAIRSSGGEVVQVRTNDEALEALASEPFDVVVSDIAKPGEEPGTELGLRMWASGQRLPLIHFVARVDPDAPPPVGSVGVTNDPSRVLELIHDFTAR